MCLPVRLCTTSTRFVLRLRDSRSLIGTTCRHLLCRVRQPNHHGCGHVRRTMDVVVNLSRTTKEGQGTDCNCGGAAQWVLPSPPPLQAPATRALRRYLLSYVILPSQIMSYVSPPTNARVPAVHHRVQARSQFRVSSPHLLAPTDWRPKWRALRLSTPCMPAAARHTAARPPHLACSAP